VTYLKALSSHLFGETDKNHDGAHQDSRYPERDSNRIQSDYSVAAVGNCLMVKGNIRGDGEIVPQDVVGCERIAPRINLCIR
jgi:hypothetical protein